MFKLDATRWQDHAAHLEAWRVGSDDDCWNYKNSIFLISKQISGEALDILYGENVFKLHLNREGESYLQKNFTEANRQRMRHL